MRKPSRSSLLVAACAALLCAAQGAAATDRGYAETAYQARAALEGVGALRSDPDGLSLQPGEFTWLAAAEAVSSSPVSLLVNLRDQRAYVYRDGERIAVTTVSTGVPGHDTPTGVFPITEKKVRHFSNRYNNAPMPYMQRLTRWGHALHAGQVRAGPASHGCVRLPAEFARQLFALTQRGDLVVIARDDSVESLARAGVDNRLAAMLGTGIPAHVAAAVRPVDALHVALGAASAP